MADFNSGNLKLFDQNKYWKILTRGRLHVVSQVYLERNQISMTVLFSGVFIVNFEHISHLALVFLLLTLNMKLPAGYVIINLHNLLDYLSTFSHCGNKTGTISSMFLPCHIRVSSEWKSNNSLLRTTGFEPAITYFVKEDSAIKPN